MKAEKLNEPLTPALSPSDGAREKAEAIARLSPAQRRVLALIGQGYMTKQIADVLQISEKGVEYHRGVIYRALNLQSIGEAVRVALEMEAANAR